MKDLYRKVRAVLRNTEAGVYERQAGKEAKKNYVLDSQGRRVNRTAGRRIAELKLSIAKSLVGSR